MRLSSLTSALNPRLRVYQEGMGLRVYRTFLGMRFEVSESTFARVAVAYVARHLAAATGQSGPSATKICPPSPRRGAGSTGVDSQANLGRRQAARQPPTNLLPATAQAAVSAAAHTAEQPAGPKSGPATQPARAVASFASLRPAATQAWEKAQLSPTRQDSPHTAEAAVAFAAAASRGVSIIPLTGGTFEDYLIQMARPRQEWGSTLETYALAQLHGISVRTFNLNGKGRFTLVDTFNPGARRSFDLVLGMNHYQYSRAPLPSAGFALDSAEFRTLGAVRGDNDCLFHCFAAVLGKPHTAESMRAEAVALLRQHGDSRLFEDGPTVAESAMMAGERGVPHKP